MKPSLSEIIRTMPHPVNTEGVTRHVNEACGLKVDCRDPKEAQRNLPTPGNSYSWSAILAEMGAQGFRCDRGVFVRGA
jgi:hypothetical protein